MNYTDINAKTVDSWVQNGWEWGRPISHETFEKAKNGAWGVYLTPTKPCRTNGSARCAARKFWV